MNKISVLIPVYNAASYIEAAIESVKKQTCPVFEIIVIDDGSADETESLIKDRDDICYIRCGHQGISYVRNRGIAEASGNWIAFIDADDLWTPDKIEKQTAYINDHPGCQIVFSKYENFTDIPVEDLTKRQKKVLNTMPYPYLASALINRSVFDKYGLFDTKYPYGEDTEWLNRLKIAGADISCQVEEVLYRRRIHRDNITLSHNVPDKNEMLSLMADSIRNARKAGKGDIK